MKRKILALVFVAVMTMGLAKTAGSNEWPCSTISMTCGNGMEGGFSGLVCGDFWEQVFQMLVYYDHYCESQL